MIRKIAASLLLLGGLAGFATFGAMSVFTSQATNPSNTFSTGSISISTSPASAFITYSDMLPGDSTTQSLDVSNDGTVELRYAISSNADDSDGKALKDQLVLTIKTIDVTTPGTPCDDFDGTQLYTGDLDGTTGARRSASGRSCRWPLVTPSRALRRPPPSRSTPSRRQITRKGRLTRREAEWSEGRRR
jgi:hypothetical protein